MARLYRGMRDFLPEEMIPREEITAKIKEVFRRWGYVPIETPAIELLETLLGKYGDEADKLIYEIKHKDGLGLRYDLTVPLARVIAMYGQNLPMPFRRYQIQPVWRAERSQKQKGRFREFIQCDVDIIGTSSPIADAEILAISAEILSNLGFERYKILLNHRQILRGLVNYAGFDEKNELFVLRSIDKWDKIGKEAVREELAEKSFKKESIDRIFELIEIDETNWNLLVELSKIDNQRVKNGVKNLRKILEYLSAVGVGQDVVQVTPRMARGLDYYTGAIFETVLSNLPSMGSLTGGGRYDDLIGMFSGKGKIPACGTTIGLDRIISALQELDKFPKAHTFTKVLVAQFSKALSNEALNFAHKLRSVGIPTEVFPEPKKLSKQFSYANKWNIPYVVLIGEDEVEEELCTLKDMSSGQQRVIHQDRAIKILLESINKK
ncbi:histidine--tRNA ligase [bacterium]|nr:MAG: histidine--tRNA ligase [bacterium]